MTEELQKILIEQAAQIGELKGVAKMTCDNVIDLKTIVTKYFDKTDTNSSQINKLHEDKKWIIGLSGLIAAAFGWVGNHFLEKFFR